MNKFSLLLRVLLLGAIFVIAGFIGDAGILSTTHNNTIQSSGFNQSYSDILVGDTINWTNRDSKIHRIVSDREEFDSGNLAPGQSYSHRFRGYGVYHYHDSTNSSMKGVILVETPGSY